MSPDAIKGIAFHPQKPYVATVKEPVYTCTFSGDAEYLVTTGKENSAYAWQWRTWKSHHEYVLKHEGTITALLTSPDDNQARMWNIATGLPIQSFPHQGEVCAVAFSSDGRYIATACCDRTISI